MLLQYSSVPVLDNRYEVRYLFRQFMDKILQREAREALRNWLRANRTAKNLPMRTIATRLGVSHSWVAKTENGERRLEIIDFVNLCFALGLDPSKGLNLLVANLSSHGGSQYGALKAAESPVSYRMNGRK
jgi:predicted transcriptional regulator